MSVERAIIIGSNTDAKVYNLFNPQYKMIKHKDLDDHTFNVDSHTQDILDTVVLLAVNEWNAKFLTALGLDPTRINNKTIKITNADSSNPPTKDQIVEHKLTDQASGERLGVHPIYGANKKIQICKQDYDYMTSYDISIVYIRQLLKEKIKDEAYIDLNHLGKILEIGEHAIYCEAGTFYFESAICTISAEKMKAFYEGSFGELKGLHSSLFLFDTKMEDDYILYSAQSIWNRINIINGKMVVDVTGRVSLKKLLHCAHGDSILEDDFLSSITIPNGKILKHSYHNLPVSIEPLGRFAEWNPDHRLEDTVMRAHMGSLYELWQGQKLLNESIVAVPFDLDSKQEQTKDYLMHLIYQSTQLLDKVNWRIHKKETNLEYDKIVEEITDMFKYWLSIANVWEVSPLDLIKANGIKTKKASEKYGNK